jgi:hypothetical protein
MRFVLVGISVCLAWIAAWKMYASGSEQQEQQGTHGEQAKQSGLSDSSSSRRSGPMQELLSWRTLLDMFTGRYIYNYCTGKEAHVVKAS